MAGKIAYPLDLSCLQSSRADIREFAREARALGVQYIGLCCGSASFLLREIAVQYGRHPPSTKYAPNLEKSAILGDVYGRSAVLMAALTGAGHPPPPSTIVARPQTISKSELFVADAAKLAAVLPLRHAASAATSFTDERSFSGILTDRYCTFKKYLAVFSLTAVDSCEIDHDTAATHGFAVGKKQKLARALLWNMVPHDEP